MRSPATAGPLRRSRQTSTQDELGNLGLSQAEENAIVTFMSTLSDCYAPDAEPR